VGDAAHTTHFTIGSGTRLALEDAIGLAEKLHEHEDLQVALKAYEEERRAAMLMLQRDARNSAQWFENVERYIGQEAGQFAYSMANRREEKGTFEEVSWRYGLHLATQKIAALRRLRRWVYSAKRDFRARRQR
jgi:2-polyprenyl-6-methoxyphenol hydroxylase-like FAD-dependent oxidoreductase